MRDFAQRLMALEADGGKAPEAETPACFRVFDRLRPRLTTLIGTGGFRTLLARALAVASAEVPWLCAMKVEADGSLAGWADVRTQVAPEECREGSVVLLAQLLGLLVTFIGLDLTSRLVDTGLGGNRHVPPWRAVKGAKNEKTN